MLVSGLNLVVDPLWIWGSGFRKEKPEFCFYVREAKPLVLHRLKPAIITLGGSSTEMGIPVSSLANSNEVVYSAALPGGTPYESRRMFNEALAGEALEKVLICIDFIKVVNQSAQTGLGFKERSFSVNADGAYIDRGWSYLANHYLFSKRTAVLSFRTLFPREITVDEWAEFHSRHIYLDDGTRAANSHLFTNDYDEGVGAIFEHSLVNISRILSGTQFRSEQLDEYRLILEVCHQEEIDYEILLSPSHGTAILAYDEMGRISDFFAFKRDVVKMENEMAVEYGQTPKGVFDFTVVEGLNTSEFLDLKFPHEKGYSDPLHFTKEIGAEVISILASEIGDEFGVRVGLNEIDAHLEDGARAIDSYKNSQPQVSAWVERVVHDSRIAMGGEL